jgi:hypothetical protein
VRFTISTVSVQGHSHAASMWEFPVKWNVARCSIGLSASRACCNRRNESSNFLLIVCVQRQQIHISDGFFQYCLLSGHIRREIGN